MSFATPLGNLDDLSSRALAVLRSVAVIACEDTRRTGRLLDRFDIEASLVSCHKFNEDRRLQPVLDRLLAGDDVALVSDGGTPGICDPGALLVAAAHRADVRVSPVPGPSIAATLLSVCGLPADRHVFEGYLPHRGGQRRRRLRELAPETRPVVFLEAPHRIRETLADAVQILGDRELVIGRELTKLHEELLRGPAASLLEGLADEPKGEFAVVVAGADPDRGDSTDDGDTVRSVWRTCLEAEDGNVRQAVKRAARELGVKRDELRRTLVELGEIVD